MSTGLCKVSAGHPVDASLGALCHSGGEGSAGHDVHEHKGTSNWIDAAGQEQSLASIQVFDDERTNGNPQADSHHCCVAAHDDHKLQDATESGLLAMTVDRTIAIRMDDKMRFYPDRFDVKAGETVKLLVSNEGSLPHELVLGSDKAITEHATEMKKHRGHHHHHAHDSKTVAISLEPGKESMLIVRFEKAGKLQMACLVPGHYEAGMRGLVTVGQRS